MTDAQTMTLVLKDAAGNYFLVPQETVEQGRVPAEHTAEVEQLIAEQQDVQGHAATLGMMIGLAVVGVGLVVSGVISVSTRAIEQSPLPGPGGIPSGSPETISTGAGPQRIQ